MNKHTSDLIMTSLPLSDYRGAKFDPLTLPLQKRLQLPLDNYLNESVHKSKENTIVEPYLTFIRAGRQSPLEELSSPYEHLITKTSTVRDDQRYDHHPYETVKNDIWSEIFPPSKQHVTSQHQPTSIFFHQNDLKNILNPISLAPVLGTSSERGAALSQEPIQSCPDYESYASLPHSTDHVYKSLSQNELNSRNSELVCGTREEVFFQETNTLKTGEKNDSTSDYECIRACHRKISPPSMETDSDGSSGRPLPVVPLDIYESLSTSKDKLSVQKLFSQRTCFWIRKISLVLTALVGFVIAAVLTTLFILKMTGVSDNIGADYYTKSPTGCPCYFNMNRNDCACCQNGGCHCPADFPHQCVKCNHDDHCGKAEIPGTVERPTRTTTLLFLDNTTLIHVIPMKIFVWGITLLGHQLFAIIGHYGASSIVNVYDSNNFTFSHTIPIIGSSNLRAIVASPRHNCLFISDVTQRVIQRYDLLSNKVITKWTLDGECWGMSLTRTGNVLVTLVTPRRIDEYTPDGTLVLNIWLDSSIDDPQHAVKLSNGQYVVSHGRTGSNHRVCAVNFEGRIIHCYGGERGSASGQLNEPRYLALDGRENVLVAEKLNDRVLVLSSALNYVGKITIPGLSQPWAIHLDELNHRLYIGEETLSGRLFVVTV